MIDDKKPDKPLEPAGTVEVFHEESGEAVVLAQGNDERIVYSRLAPELAEEVARRLTVSAYMARQRFADVKPGETKH